MGVCNYCGKSAGFFRKEHKECVVRHDRAISSIKEICVEAALSGAGLGALEDRIREEWSAVGATVSNSTVKESLIGGWNFALQAALEDQILSTEEKRGLNRYRRRFGISEAELNESGDFKVFKIMALLKTMTDDGVIPRFDRVSAEAEFGRLPFNMMKSEELVWAFPDVGYMEQVTRREFRGESLGASFRVAKGVYVRPGAFRGRSVATKSMELTDSGLFGITTKHIYFTGSEKSFRVRLEKIVSFTPYQDGLGIMRDTARAKPEIFAMPGNDPWLAINLIETLLNMEDVALPKGDAPTLDDIVEEDGDDDDNVGGLFAAGASMSH